jgi:acyl-CoA thioesterase YciA
MDEDNHASRFFNKGAKERVLTLQLAARYKDTIADDYISAGWLLSEMDTAAGMRAHAYTGGRTVTRAIDAMSFPRPVQVGDILQIFTEVVNQGRSSMTVKVESWAESRKTQEYQKVTEGLFTFVAVSGNRRPVDIATGQEITDRPQRTQAPDPPPRGTPSTPVLMTDKDRNYLRDIFGGRVLEVMDMKASEVAQKYAGHEVATRAIEEMAFHKPVLPGDSLVCYTEVVKTGDTSVTIKVETWAERTDGRKEKVTEGKFTYVALDKNRKPVSIAPNP